MTPTVGFIGLGAMGRPLSQAILHAGYPLVVFDQNHGALSGVADEGAAPATSVKDLADRAEVVFTCLPTPQILREVLAGPEGVLEGTAVTTIVDLSTIGATTTVELAELARAQGIAYVDAPVSGGVTGAQARTLAVMASGAPAAVDGVRPLLETFGKAVFFVGSEAGHGQIAKVLNNLISATSVVITAEVTTMASRAGLDVTTLLQVFSAGSGRNTATTDKFPKHVLTRQFASGFKLALMHKDLGLCLDEARRLRAPMLVGGLVHQLWSVAAEQLPEEADHTEIVRLFEQWAGVEISG